MKITRRKAVGLLAGVSAAAVGRVGGQQDGPEIERGRFQGTRASLKGYRVPDWYRDAKFGIWAHWGPQSAPEYGDWYARRMYEEGSRIYKYHVQTYGHPSKFGYKDVIPTWKAENFDADHLVQLYRKAGAKYFVSMGVHHDNFDMWNSKHQPKWNAVAMGPKKDIVQLFRKAALREGLRFGVSQHLHPSYEWMATAFGADKQGPLAGVPYDGNDPRYADLYHEKHNAPQNPGDVSKVPLVWKKEFFLRIKDLIDQAQPDLLYTDGVIRFQEWGLSLLAHLYNQSARLHNGRVEAVYNSKGIEDCQTGTCALDFERGIAQGIWPEPWQTDTCIGEWHYNKEAVYKTPKNIIDLLVDIVSKNGNLMLNFPLKSDGTLDPKEQTILADITRWMAVNSEAIHGTRPWNIFGDGPGLNNSNSGLIQPKLFPEIPDSSYGAERSSAIQTGERRSRALTAQDFRFTAKGNTLYAFVMGWPENETTVRPLSTTTTLGVKVHNVELLGFTGKVKWNQDAAGLKVELPAQKPCDHAIALRIALA